MALGLLLASYANEDGTGIRVSPDAMAAMLGCPKAVAERRLKGLVRDGWLKAAMVNGGEASVRLALPKSK